MSAVPPIPTELAKRLGCYQRDRFWPRRPTDGGDYFDTYAGWQQRGRQVRKGAQSLRCSGGFDLPRYPWYETAPLVKCPSNNLNLTPSTC